MGNVDEYKAQLDLLVKKGNKWALTKLQKSEDYSQFQAELLVNGEYQKWYTECCLLLKQLLPDRLREFQGIYASDEKRSSIGSRNFTIQDWLRGSTLHAYNSEWSKTARAVRLLLMNQVSILEAVTVRFDSTLVDIRQILQAEMFDSEVESARELTRRGFLRAAGAVAGVVLERHLKQVATDHNIIVRKKEPSIGTLNDLLKDEGVVDLTAWKEMQYLGQLRNLCDHDKEREPTKDEVATLINGVEKYTNTLT